MAIHDLKGSMARLPAQPGVYLFLDRAGETLYVGKARVLCERVRSYLGAAGTSPRIDALLRDAAGLDTIVTDSVVEALALENRLIKQRNPRYNVLLRDDKTYPYLQLTTTEPAPRVLVARRIERDGTVYAGPFMPAAVARRTMALTHRLFGIRSCNEIIDGRRDRPCLEYDIKRCLAPCVASICTLDEYGRAVEQARLLLEGRQGELTGQLRREMAEAAATERYERAAHLRDAIRTIETLQSQQNKLDTPALGDRDAFGLALGPAGSVVTVFLIRRGRVVDRLEFAAAAAAPPPVHPTADPSHAGTSGAAESAEVLDAAIREVYRDRQPPPEVLLPAPLADDDQAALVAWLRAQAGRRVALVQPHRGARRGLLELATRNAALAYQTHFSDRATAAYAALEALRGVLALPALPRRIDAFDISTLQGRETVASMVVSVDGRLRKSEYRKFRIRGPEAARDDFAAMREVVRRRYQRVLDQGGPFPDLILIDGGKGQLGAAYGALHDVGLDRLIAIGLAKEEETIVTRDRADGLRLPRDSPALRLLQRLRDEAHRFAVTFHRRARTKRTLHSALDDIDGIGPRRRQQLLSAFGSVAGVRRASRAELVEVVGNRAADRVLEFFVGTTGTTGTR
ncbi:MAG TPA: excinuclease ABC subunit UvrC [Vicinamibacterales bacterium]|nr:excinuclease ABC subunit UvrC [Vicinamibacterales bacterium]